MIRPSVLHVVCYSCVHLCVLAAQAQSPDMILYHGHIFTGDTAIPWVEAISIHGNTILATGSNAKVMATADKHTQIIDLQGRMAMPGINDAHEHVGGARYGIEAVTKLPPAAHPSIDDVAEAVRVAAGGAAAGEVQLYLIRSRP